jgi:hypothetical protein
VGSPEARSVKPSLRSTNMANTGKGVLDHVSSVCNSTVLLSFEDRESNDRSVQNMRHFPTAKIHLTSCMGYNLLIRRKGRFPVAFQLSIGA